MCEYSTPYLYVEPAQVSTMVDQSVQRGLGQRAAPVELSHAQPLAAPAPQRTRDVGQRGASVEGEGMEDGAGHLDALHWEGGGGGTHQLRAIC